MCFFQRATVTPVAAGSLSDRFRGGVESFLFAGFNFPDLCKILFRPAGSSSVGPRQKNLAKDPEN